MKPYIFLCFFLIFIISCRTHSEVATNNSETKSKTEIQKSEQKEKAAAYKVLRKAPTLKFQVYKNGEGNKVLFYEGGSGGRLPNEIQISPSNGVPYKEGRKMGYYQLNFPVKFSIYCPSNNMTNPFDSMAQMINDFEIEFYETGNWEVKFIR